MPIKITFATFSDKGEREANEDAVGFSSTAGKSCFVLCDGLGGHGLGEIASSLVVQVILSVFQNHKRLPIFLKEAFSAAQDILLAEQIKQNARKQMKTTVTVLALDCHRAYIGHVGDSRVYVFQNNQVRKRTLDHSIPQQLVAAGEITPDEIRNHPDRNFLLRVMGTPWEDPQYELMKPIFLKRGQAFLLCSDGFWEFVDESTMCSLLEKSTSVQEWVNGMAEIARINGNGKNMDNFSAIGVWCEKRRWAFGKN